MTALFLAIIAAIESIVYLWRIRSGVGSSRWQSATSTVAVCATRMLWLYAGVSATISGQPLLGGIAYCMSAGIATFAVHHYAETRRSTK